MHSKIRFGIIGCSSIAERSTIPAIKESSRTKLQMIGSRSFEKAKKFSTKFSCNSYGSYDEVLEREDIDAIYISLPIGLQEKWVIKSAKAGKHILCEKSAAVSYDSAKKMIKECKKNNVRLMEAFMFRFHPQHQRVQKIIQQNLLGKVFSYYGKLGFFFTYSPNNYRFKKDLGGGAFNDLGCYLICSSRMIFRHNPTVIFCKLYPNKKNQVDLKGNIHMIYPNNCIANGTFGYENDFQSTYELWGSKGLINLEWAFNIPKNKFAIINYRSKNISKKIRVKPSNQFKLMINNFCNELLGTKPSDFNYENELISQALVMEAARLSNEKKKPIYLNEIK